MWWLFIAGAVVCPYSDDTINSFSDVTFCAHYTVSSYSDDTFTSNYTIGSQTIATPFHHSYTTATNCSTISITITITAYFWIFTKYKITPSATSYREKFSTTTCVAGHTTNWTTGSITTTRKPWISTTRKPPIATKDGATCTITSTRKPRVSATW